MAEDKPLDAVVLRTWVMANGCMLQALAATHPEPDKLRAAFETQASQLLAALTDHQSQGAAKVHLDTLKKHIPAS